MSLDAKKTYDVDFFEHIRSGSKKSAAVIVPFINELFHPKSVIDLGCGDGTWLKQFLDNGVKSVFGIDGSSLPPRFIKFHKIRYNAIVNNPITVKERYDLA